MKPSPEVLPQAEKHHSRGEARNGTVASIRASLKSIRKLLSRRSRNSSLLSEAVRSELRARASGVSMPMKLNLRAPNRIAEWRIRLSLVLIGLCGGFPVFVVPLISVVFKVRGLGEPPGLGVSIAATICRQLSIHGHYLFLGAWRSIWGFKVLASMNCLAAAVGLTASTYFENAFIVITGVCLLMFIHTPVTEVAVATTPFALDMSTRFQVCDIFDKLGTVWLIVIDAVLSADIDTGARLLILLLVVATIWLAFVSFPRAGFYQAKPDDGAQSDEERYSDMVSVVSSISASRSDVSIPSRCPSNFFNSGTPDRPVEGDRARALSVCGTLRDPRSRLSIILKACTRYTFYSTYTLFPLMMMETGCGNSYVGLAIMVEGVCTIPIYWLSRFDRRAFEVTVISVVLAVASPCLSALTLCRAGFWGIVTAFFLNDVALILFNAAFPIVQATILPANQLPATIRLTAAICGVIASLAQSQAGLVEAVRSLTTILLVTQGLVTLLLLVALVTHWSEVCTWMVVDRKMLQLSMDKLEECERVSSNSKTGAADLCANGCGRQPAQGHPTCCQICTRSHGQGHAPWCDSSIDSVVPASSIASGAPVGDVASVGNMAAVGV